MDEWLHTDHELLNNPALPTDSELALPFAVPTGSTPETPDQPNNPHAAHASTTTLARAQDNMRRAQEKDKVTYARRHTAAVSPQQSMPVGSLVWLKVYDRSKQQGGKLAFKVEGPFKVMHWKETGSAIIADNSPAGKQWTVAAANISPLSRKPQVEPVLEQDQEGEE
jgi:hypothetical protein